MLKIKKIISLGTLAFILCSCGMFPSSTQKNSSSVSSSGNDNSTSLDDSSNSSDPVSPASPIEGRSALDIYFIEMTAGDYGDSIYLTIDNGNNSSFDILIDCGWQVDGTFVHSFLKNKMKDNTIDIFIGTHPHGDHIAGFTNMLGNDLNITTIIDYGTTSGSTYYTKKRTSLVSNGTTWLKYYEAINSNDESKQLFTLNNDSNFKMRLLNTGLWSSAGKCSSTDVNAQSVATLFTYYDFSFLTMGDGVGDSETYIINNYDDILPSGGVTLFKANHHGSNSNGSNGQAFLNRIKPKAVGISASRVDVDSSDTNFAYNNATAGGSFDDSKNKTCASTSYQLHPNETTVSRYLSTSLLKTSKNVYWNMYAGSMLFETYGEDIAPSMQGSGPTIGYYATDSSTAKVTGENNKKYVDTVAYQSRH